MSSSHESEATRGRQPAPPILMALTGRDGEVDPEQVPPAIEAAYLRGREDGMRLHTTYMEPDFSELKPVGAGEDAPPNLLRRLTAAMLEVDKKVPELGRNQDQGYNYARVDEVVQHARQALASNGVYAAVSPLREEWEEIQFRNGGRGRRLVMHGRVTVMNADDPQDQLQYELGAANDGIGDKGQQVCYSTLRKYMLIELLLLPRGVNDDAEAQKSNELAPANGGQQQGAQSGSQGGGGRRYAEQEGPPDAELAELVEAERYEEAWQRLGVLANKGGKQISQPQLNRLYARAGEQGWSRELVDKYLRSQLQILPPHLPRAAYDAVVWYFDNVTHGDEWTWERCWEAVREGFDEGPVPAMPAGALEGWLRTLERGGWSAQDVQGVLENELGKVPSELPAPEHRLTRMVHKILSQANRDGVLEKYEPPRPAPAPQPAPAAPSPPPEPATEASGNGGKLFEEPESSAEPDAVDYGAKTAGELRKLAEERGCLPESGSGVEGRVVKEDLVAALVQADLEGGAQ